MTPEYAEIGEPVYEDDSEIDLTSGSADSSHAPDPDRPIARIYLPSVEHTSGYRDHYVYPSQPKAPKRRTFGFRA